MADSIKGNFEQTKVKELMSKAVCIREDEEFSKAQVLFKENRAFYLIVVTEQNKYQGILSQKFLFKAQSPRKIISEEMMYDPNVIIDGDSFYDKEVLNNYILRKIMYRGAFTLKPDDNVALVVEEMSKRKITCIPIVDDNRKVHGVITNEEVFDFLNSQLKS